MLQKTLFSFCFNTNKYSFLCLLYFTQRPHSAGLEIVKPQCTIENISGADKKEKMHLVFFMEKFPFIFIFCSLYISLWMEYIFKAVSILKVRENQGSSTAKCEVQDQESSEKNLEKNLREKRFLKNVHQFIYQNILILQEFYFNYNSILQW